MKAKRISKDRILQISNDISEGELCTTDVASLVAVIEFWRDRCDEWINAYNELSGQCTSLFLKTEKIRSKLTKP